MSPDTFCGSTYTMPFDGFATLVVKDGQGSRVKNLIGMAPRSKGGRAHAGPLTFVT